MSAPVVVFLVVAAAAAYLIVRTMRRTESMYRDADVDPEVRNERYAAELAKQQGKPDDDRWGPGWGVGRSRARRRGQPPAPGPPR